MSDNRTAMKNLEERFKSSFMFGQYYEECMETEKVLKGNCWNIDVLIGNCNSVIEKFIKSPFTTIDKFFRTYIVKNCKKAIQT